MSRSRDLGNRAGAQGTPKQEWNPSKARLYRRLGRFQKRQGADPELARAHVDHATCVATGDPQLEEK